MIEAVSIHRHCSSTYSGHLCAPMCTAVHLCAFIRAAVTHALKVSLSREDSSQVCWDWLSLQAVFKRRQEVKAARSFLFLFLFSEATVKFTGEWQSGDSHSPDGGLLCLPGGQQDGCHRGLSETVGLSTVFTLNSGVVLREGNTVSFSGCV